MEFFKNKTYLNLIGILMLSSPIWAADLPTMLADIRAAHEALSISIYEPMMGIGLSGNFLYPEPYGFYDELQVETKPTENCINCVIQAWLESENGQNWIQANPISCILSGEGSDTFNALDHFCRETDDVPPALDNKAIPPENKQPDQRCPIGDK